MARLPYTSDFAISVGSVDATTGTAVTSVTFRTNGLFDPEFSFGGTQPYQFDQLVLFYSSYIVYGAKFDLTFYNPDTDGLIVGARVRNGTSIATSGIPLNNMNMYQRVVMQPMQNTGSQVWRTSIYVANNEVFGLTKDQYNDVTYAAPTSADPGAVSLLEPFAYSTVAGTANVVRVSAKVTYYVKFYDPRQVAVS